MKKVIFTLSLICSTVFSTQSENCHENINKDFTYCKAEKNDTNVREWHRQRNQLDKDGKPVYQWCKEVYTSSDKNDVAKCIKDNTSKHGFGNDCEYSYKGCLTDKC
jgi:hypothetical protein